MDFVKIIVCKLIQRLTFISQWIINVHNEGHDYVHVTLLPSSRLMLRCLLSVSDSLCLQYHVVLWCGRFT